MSTILTGAVRGHILDSTARVTRAARHVALDRRAARRLALALHEDHGAWLTSPPRRDKGDEKLFRGDDNHVAWLFVVDALNFSFWDEDEAGRWRWTPPEGGDPLTGALGAGRSLRAAYARGVPLCDASFIETVTEEELRSVFGGEGELPMMAERCSVLNETGRVLNALYGGHVMNLLAATAHTTDAALTLLLRDFPSFKDVTTFDGHEVYFLKRAQLFLSDLWEVFGGEGFGRLHDLDNLTAASDYKLPQLLRAGGVIRYDGELSGLVDTRTPLAHGSRHEVEIRAATVQGVELVLEELRPLSARRVPACRLDSCLWWLSRGDACSGGLPHHRTRTVFY